MTNYLAILEMIIFMVPREMTLYMGKDADSIYGNLDNTRCTEISALITSMADKVMSSMPDKVMTMSMETKETIPLQE